MPPTNVIVNGDFSARTSGWTGTDLETNPLSRYISGAGDGSNRVAEMDGRSGQTTVLEQTFTLDDPSVATLTFDAALRTSALSDAGSDGYTVEILDSSGNVLVSQTILPSTNSFTTVAIPVTFPSAGDYTIRFTEVGDDDSRGALLDNVQVLICFAGETSIATLDGPVAAAKIRTGDLVMTESGPRPVRWVGRRQVSAQDMSADPSLRPVRIARGALGQGVPSRDLMVSRQHRMLVVSPVAERMFGTAEVLVPAIRLTALPGISVEPAPRALTYVHILLDDHAVVFAEDAPAESLYVGDCVWAGLSEAAQGVVQAFCPHAPQGRVPDPARLIPSQKHQKKLLDRMARNGRLALDGRVVATSWPTLAKPARRFAAR
ncbi:MAG: Hint domain-containing protein [Pseudomonadota bacterium]